MTTGQGTTGYGQEKHDPEGLTTNEGVDERGTDAEAAGRAPGDGPPGAGSPDDRGATSAPGLAVSDADAALDWAPEPNEPA